MHSSLGKELRGTSKLLRSAHSPSPSRSLVSKRRLASCTRLLSKPDANGNSVTSGDKKDSVTTDQNGAACGNRSATTEHDLKLLDTLNRMLQEITHTSGHYRRWRSYRKEEPKPGLMTPRLKEILDEVGVLLKESDKEEHGLALRGDEGRTRSPNPSKTATDAPSANDHTDLRMNEDDKEPLTQDVQPDASSTSVAQVEGQESQNSDKEQAHKPNLASGGESFPPESNDPLAPKYYGSGLARRQRERLIRSREKLPAFILPDWFNKRGVLVWGDGRLDPRLRPRVSIAESPYPTHFERIDGEPRSLESNVKPVDEEKNSSQPAERTCSINHTSMEFQDTKKNQHYLKQVPEMRESEQVDLNPESLTEQDIQNQADTAEKQSFANGGSGDPQSDGGDSPVAPDTKTTSGTELKKFVPVNNEYYLHAAQFTELSMTIQGRLRLPASGSIHSKPGGIKSHVLVHYTASDGDLFLHHLIIDIARDLHCNLIQIDAQDISALIAKADIDPMLLDEAKTLSYEVFGELYREEGSEEEDQQSVFAEEVEDGDEDGPGPKGVPFMVGKPITIDLKAIFGPKNSRKFNPPFFQKNAMPDMFGRTQMGKPSPHVFSSIVDSILSSPRQMRKSSNADVSKDKEMNLSEDNPHTRYLPQDATIVHIKDLRAIQDTNIGKHFLSQVYEQVNRRRANGEGIMLVGTECARESNSVYDAERIRNMQLSDPDEISSTVVLTPVSPNPNIDDKSHGYGQFHNEFTAKRDRAKRLRMINARHLYEMLQSKDVTIEPLREGFWAKEFARELTKDDRDCLAKSFWSFSYVQRLAAIMASSAASSEFKTASDSPILTSVSILEESDMLKTIWVKEAQSQRSKPNRKEQNAGEPENQKLAAIRSKATKHEKKLLGGVIEPKKISTTFRDIHIPTETVDALQTLTTLSLVRPDAFKYGVLASDRIPGLLLYGPPGTGKTLAAKAVAKESGATMLEVSAADINDMYVGEGEKNVKALFSLAKKLSPCIVFLDEADAMFSSRSHAGRRVSHRELLNQFLKEWDGMSNDSGSAFIMVATNRPMDLDDAVLRRLPRRLLIDLPTEKDRVEILGIHLGGEEVSADVDIKDLAARTPFYSGSDLKNVAVAAALNCVREENERAKQHTGEEPFQYQPKRILTAAHFDRALEEIGASISEDMSSLRDIKKFDEQYGDKKGRKRRSPKWGFKTAAEADAVLDTVKVRS